MKKIAVYYDSLLAKGGAEREVILLANYLHADIITSGFNPELKKWMPITGNVIDLGNSSIKIFAPLGILFEAPLRYFFTRKKLEYDVHIFCGFTSLYGAKKGNTNIWRCFTPNRIMYDLKKDKLHDPNILKSFAFWLHAFLFTRLDQKIVKTRFKKIIVQSENVQKRVKHYYGIIPMLIYDPVETKKFYFTQFGDFYLTVSRLFPEKRVDMIVDAFLKMPDKKLVIVGDGPEKELISKKITNAKNITLFTNIQEKKLLELYAQCLATIFLPKDEDYGLIPLESMASGKPCIAVNEGGCRETVINGKTGFLIKANANQLINTIKTFDFTIAKSMKQHCLNQAKKFDVSSSFKQWDVALHAFK